MSRHWTDYLRSKGARFSDDRIDFPATNADQSAHMCILSSQQCIEANGPDAQKFLQGQLTCNVAQLNALQHTQGAVCTNKGRMYASFALIYTGSRYLFRMNKSLTEHFIKTLGKYAVFFKSDLAIPETPYLCLGLTGTDTPAILNKLWGLQPDHVTVNEIHNAFLIKAGHLKDSYELWLPENQLPVIWDQLTPHFAPVGETQWQQQRITAVIPEVNAITLEKYTPQHFNLPSLNYVSFRKGCYTGQEVVARLQNLGQQKSRAHHLTITSPTKLSAGLRLLNAKGLRAGELIEVVSLSAGQYEALAIIRIDTDSLFVEAHGESQIIVHPIPYPIDTRAELKH